MNGRMPIDDKITTVVGENESGKTHLLTAIEKGIRGEGIEREDFCRYSQFFAVEQGKMKWPDFGFEWAGLSKDEKQQLITAAAIDKPGAFDSFHLFRTGKDRLTVYLPGPTGFSIHEVPTASVKAVVDLLPNVFHMEAHIALPESVPIRWLADGSPAGKGLESMARDQRVGLFEKLYEKAAWFATKESVTQAAGEIVTTMAVFTGDNLSPSRCPSVPLVVVLDVRLAEQKWTVRDYVCYPGSCG